MHKFAYAYDRCACMLMSFERIAFQLIQCIWRICYGDHKNILVTKNRERFHTKILMPINTICSHLPISTRYLLLKLINYSCADDPISLHQLSQVHVFWYPMNIPIKTHSISSKTDQDTDQETWILISLNTKYSIFAASVVTYNNNRATYYSLLLLLARSQTPSSPSCT